jgi:hypothetical protein
VQAIEQALEVAIQRSTTEASATVAGTVASCRYLDELDRHSLRRWHLLPGVAQWSANLTGLVPLVFSAWLLRCGVPMNCSIWR